MIQGWAVELVSVFGRIEQRTVYLYADDSDAGLHAAEQVKRLREVCKSKPGYRVRKLELHQNGREFGYGE